MTEDIINKYIKICKESVGNKQDNTSHCLAIYYTKCLEELDKNKENKLCDKLFDEYVTRPPFKFSFVKKTI